MNLKGIILTIALAGGIGFAAGYAMVQHSLARQKAAWQAEKKQLAEEIAPWIHPSSPKTIIPLARVVQVTNTVSPEDILEQLAAMKVSQGNPRSVRQVIHGFESLIEAGTAALPAIRTFLARNQDVEYEVGFGRGGRDGNVPLEFSVPPSL